MQISFQVWGSCVTWFNLGDVYFFWQEALKSSALLFMFYSMVAQLVRNLPSMQETWVRFLGQEDPLEKGMETHSSILA